MVFNNRPKVKYTSKSAVKESLRDDNSVSLRLVQEHIRIEIKTYLELRLYGLRRLLIRFGLYQVVCIIRKYLRSLSS